jgi:predicted enzyme related to lactoylglutathione lyase
VFSKTEVFSGFSVDDVSEVGWFYGETLGMKVSEASEPMRMLELHIAGGHNILVYEKLDHTPASFTVLYFPVEDTDEVVDELTARGVRFDDYDGTDEKGIFRGEGRSIAWFKDPAGNALSAIQLD